MKRPKIDCGWGSAPEPTDCAEGAYEAPQAYIVGWRGGHPFPNFFPLDAFDRCSWTFAGTGRKDGHP